MSYYKIETLGCKVNSYESDSIIQILESNGYQMTKEMADIVIINTCSVTHVSEAKCRQKIRRLIKENKDAIVIVMGCYAQISSQDIAKINGVNIIIGSQNKYKVIEYIEEYKKNHQQINKVIDFVNILKFEDNSPISYSDKTRAYIKIEDGCNNYCSYCIIPYTRGSVRSRSKGEIIKEINNLVSNGYKEIVLTGIHTGGYGMDINYNLELLIVDILKETKVETIRISSIEFTEISDQLIRLIKDNDRIARHFHIPLQSGSSKILKKMNRKYNRQDFIDKIRKLKADISDLMITTDIIVGFPGETEDDFQDSVDLVKMLDFLKIHIFEYSIRNGTPAANLPDQIDSKIKKRRSHELSEIGQQSYLKIIQNLIGSRTKVLFEEYKDGYLIGHTSNYLKIYVECNDLKLVNEISDVEIISIKQNQLIAIMVEKE